MKTNKNNNLDFSKEFEECTNEGVLNDWGYAIFDFDEEHKNKIGAIIPTKQMRGVMSSLIKKDLITFEETKNTGYDIDVITIFPEQFEKLKNEMNAFEMNVKELLKA